MTLLSAALRDIGTICRLVW